jgi:ABC-2 type transport system ATP-binding protein
MQKSQEPAVIVRDLYKEFLLPQHRNTSLKQAFVNIGRKNVVKHQKVLDGISFEVNQGDFFGIVGRNGSGKSTLLKILAGVYSPTAGSVEMRGNLTPFIELGVGFNPELSGRDNVFLNGALLGFNRKEMAAMYDEIVDFAELGQFMDQKLKNYSSGMQVRLAFSIAVKAKNDILIFDEVLAVGDEAFQRKCIDIFEHYKANRQTIILVTHDMETVKKFCNRAILISEGRIIESGNPRKVANHYSDLNQAEIDRGTAAGNKRSGGLHTQARTTDADGKQRHTFDAGTAMIAEVSWDDGLSDVESVGINILKESGEHITGYNSKLSGIDDILTSGRLGLEFELELAPGRYYLLVEVYDRKGRTIDAILNGPRFSVVAKDGVAWSGLVPVGHRWKRLA